MNRGETNKHEALSNIRKKIGILKTLIENGTQLTSIHQDYYPTTIRQFNLWDMRQNTAEFNELHGPIKTNANDTLRKYPALILEVETTIAALKLASKKPKEKEAKASALKLHIQKLQAYINTLEKQTALQQVTIMQLESTNLLQTTKLNNIINEYRKIITKNGLQL